MAAQQPADTLSNISDGAELAHVMLWETYERATRVQAWMLQQASNFTPELHSKPRSVNRRGTS